MRINLPTWTVPFFALVLLLNVASFPRAICAAELEPNEPYLEVLNGLRTRQYYDTAIFYLESLEKNPKVPAVLKQAIPLEKADTLLENSRSQRNPDAQSRLLEEALKQLALFTRKSPSHPRAPDANTKRGSILLEKAKIFVVKSKSGKKGAEQKQFQEEARKLVGQARRIFQKAAVGFKKKLDSFPISIPAAQTEKIAARNQAGRLSVQAELNLALCTYEEAHTYQEESKQANGVLQKAGLEFKKIYEAHRDTLPGLYAHLMHGKCFQEQGEIRKALGVFDHIKAFRGTEPEVLALKDQAFQYRLECLIHKKRKDYQVAVDEVKYWLEVNESRAGQRQVLGIKWQKARAYEFWSKERGVSVTLKRDLLNRAQLLAKEIRRFPGPYRLSARNMYDRLQIALGREGKQPKDFDSAYELAMGLVTGVSQLKSQIDDAKLKKNVRGANTLEKELEVQLEATRRMIQLAIQYAGTEKGIEIELVNSLRYRLAFIYYTGNQKYEAAVTGIFLAKHYGKMKDASAFDAAYLALVSLSQLHFRTAFPSERASLSYQMEELGRLMESQWGGGTEERVNEARLRIGKMLRRDKNPLAAAQWFARVPASSDQYSVAQIEKGKAYWRAYSKALSSRNASYGVKKGGAGAASLEEINGWLVQAETAFKIGITGLQRDLKKGELAPDLLVRGKASLAKIQIRKGNDLEAIKLLVEEPYSVVAAISVSDESKRPKIVGHIRSRKFASFIYQQLLRAYVGAKNLPKAREARVSLEGVVGAEGKAALTGIYVELGRELQNELEGLKQAGNKQRAREVRNAFESFLQDLFKQKEGQSYGSLIWIAETYFGLGMSAIDNQSISGSYFKKAIDVYDEILARVKSNPQFADAKRIPAIQLRLAVCKRHAGDFAGAELLIGSVLKARPTALNVQFDAANLYQQWGEKKEIGKLEIAISGTKLSSGVTIWGWQQMANRLKTKLRAKNSDSKYQEQHRQARYHLAECRLILARKTKNESQKKLELERAVFEITTFTRISRGLPKSDWWGRFDSLYQSILAEKGDPVQRLKVPTLITQSPIHKKKLNPKKMKSKKVASVESPKKQTEEESSLAPILMGVAVVGGILIAVFIFMRSGKPKKRKGYLPDDNLSSPVAIEERKRKKKPSQQSQQRKRKPRPPGSQSRTLNGE